MTDWAVAAAVVLILGPSAGIGAMELALRAVRRRRQTREAAAFAAVRAGLADVAIHGRAIIRADLYTAAGDNDERGRT